MDDMTNQRWPVKVLIDDDAENVNVTPKWRAVDTLRGFVRPPGSLKGESAKQA
jgi:hypothetical protein